MGAGSRAVVVVIIIKTRCYWFTLLGIVVISVASVAAQAMRRVRKGTCKAGESAQRHARAAHQPIALDAGRTRVRRARAARALLVTYMAAAFAVCEKAGDATHAGSGVRR